MSAETFGLVLQAVNALAVPALIGVGRYLWRMERRMLKLEIKLGVESP